ncbi:MAG: ATPase, T2SS/T4P/T4SS family [Sedimentisphaerales bacterium]|nr:ATPase, T2SS/T4P/T4SS family [Sedimentisphaerales bacterium]
MALQSTEAKQQLGQILLARRMIDQAHLEQALSEQERGGHRQLLGEILVQKGYCTEQQVAIALAESYGIPYARVTPRICDPKVIEVLPRQFCQEYLVLPMFRVHNNLTVAMADPTNLFLIDQIEHLTGYRVQVVCATATDILATLRAYSPDAGAFVLEESLPAQEQSSVTVIQSARQASDPAAAFNQPAIVELVNYVLAEAVRMRASHIYIEPCEANLRVRYRAADRLIEKARPPVQLLGPVVARLKLMAGLADSAKAPLQATVRAQLEGRPMDLCMTFLEGSWGEHVVIHLADPDRYLMRLESLGFTIQNLQNLRRVIEARSGLVIICGPVGSGRKTTARAILLELYRPDANICTIEDQIECFIPNVNQFQASTSDMLQTVSYVLRHQPDVLMIDNLNDPAVARSVVHTASSGRLVIVVTDHMTIEQAMAGLSNLGIGRWALAQSLAAVLEVRLVGKVCPNCKQAAQGGAGLAELAARSGRQIQTYYSGKGCNDCGNTGLLGKIGLHQLLVPTVRLREMISHGQWDLIRQAAIEDGMIPLLTDAVEKVRSGIVPLEQVSRYIESELVLSGYQACPNLTSANTL